MGGFGERINVARLEVGRACLRRGDAGEVLQADACIIGAGIAGLTTAYMLAREGKSVIVLHDGRWGEGMTSRTTAHLSNAFDDRYVEVERLHGLRGSQIVPAMARGTMRRDA